MLCVGGWCVPIRGLVRHQSPNELEVLLHHLAPGLIGFVQDGLNLSVLLLGDFELLGNILTKYRGRSLDLELDLLEPLHLGLVQGFGQFTFRLVLKLLHCLAHHLAALGLHGVSRPSALELCGLLLQARIDLAAPWMRPP